MVLGLFKILISPFHDDCASTVLVVWSHGGLQIENVK